MTRIRINTKEIKECKICGKEFTLRHFEIARKKSYCSRECFFKTIRGKTKEPMSEEIKRKISNTQKGKLKIIRPPVICKRCGKSFVGRNTRTEEFCSFACYRDEMQKHRIKYTCKTCQKLFLGRRGARVKIYCSADCRMNGMRGGTRESSEWREDSDGYLVHGKILQHRQVAEKIIGRPLTKAEVIHHIDENKKNNSPDNLYIFANSKEHSTYHMDVKFFRREPITVSNLQDIANRGK